MKIKINKWFFALVMLLIEIVILFISMGISGTWKSGAYSGVLVGVLATITFLKLISHD